VLRTAWQGHETWGISLMPTFASATATLDEPHTCSRNNDDLAERVVRRLLDTKRSTPSSGGHPHNGQPSGRHCIAPANPEATRRPIARLVLPPSSASWQSGQVVEEFGIPGPDIRKLVTGRGWCYASNLITKHGKRVGWMYREVSEGGSSGWVFFAGIETDKFVDEPSNFGIYDVNTIVNYDPSIVVFLDAPAGSAFEREATSQDFVSVPEWKLPED